MTLIYVVMWCNKEWLTKKKSNVSVISYFIYIYIQMGIRIAIKKEGVLQLIKCSCNYFLICNIMI